MKTKSRIIMVLGIMTIAMVTAGVPLTNQYETGTTTDELTGCYTDQEVVQLMEAGNYQREQAVELLKLACKHAVSVEFENE
ncbi:MAG TPA: hypothetical protein VFU05_09905 [Cyclobacteriaceae bacterium]|nr:hypothetical protein [Cyclobacteriaceae bacterium]